MIKLDEFTSDELHILLGIVYKQIDLKRNMKFSTIIDQMKEKLRNDIVQLELLSVKINNHLGKYN